VGRRSRKRQPAGAAPPAPPARRPRRSSEERNQEVRAQLEPLEAGERPLPLVVAAATAALLALVNFVAWLAGVEVEGKQPSVAGVLAFCGVLGAAAWGMWARRYWAVLGFQCLLAIVVIIFFLFLLRASSITDVLIAGGIIAYAGTLFWKLVRVLARLQIPERPGAQRPDR
jgi:hypothetical protein